MPLLDIATAQSSFQNNISRIVAQSLFHNKFLGLGNERRLASGWKPFPVPMKGNRFDVEGTKMQISELLIKAVATLEPNCSVKINGGDEGIGSLQMAEIQHQSPGEEKEVDERERLRRMRISKANKGNTPWNKGRKHRAETLQRIKERTRQAMQDPKVKMKLVNLGHAHSEETRMKIGVGVRVGWERRREKLMLQETCYFGWQNLIAESSRRGFVGEEELQWDSYMILDEQLEKEWLESVEQRKEMAKPKGNRRAPKPLEQRRRISEAIAAKWADPAYRDRVCSGLAKYFGMPVGAERKPKRRTSGERQPKTQSATKKVAKDACKSSGNGTKSQSSCPRKSNTALYKDPLASSKLEMIKNIRAQRAAAESKTTEAIEQAKLLIAEAEKAAKALEAPAMRSPLAWNSLIEARKLIAEAVQSIRSIDTGENDSHGVESNPNYHSLSQTDREEVNGIQTVDLGKINVGDFSFGKLNFQDYVNGEDVLVKGKNSKDGLYQTGEDDCGFVSTDFGRVVKQQSFIEQLGQFETDGINSRDKKLLINGSGLSAFRSRREEEEAPPDSTPLTKKWVRGKLVELVEGELLG